MKVRKAGLMIIVEINGVKFYYGIIPKEDGYLAPDSFKPMTEEDFERAKIDTEEHGQEYHA